MWQLLLKNMMQINNPAVYDDSPTNATFKITDCK